MTDETTPAEPAKKAKAKAEAKHPMEIKQEEVAALRKQLEIAEQEYAVLVHQAVFSPTPSAE